MTNFSKNPSPTEIQNFLLTNPSYMKKGAGWLANRLNCSEQDVTSARSAVRKIHKKILSKIDPKKYIPTPQSEKYFVGIDPCKDDDLLEFEKEDIKILQTETEPYQPKILVFDIETAPLKAYVWRLWKQDIYLDQIISEWFMLTWSAKWLDSPDVMSNKLTPEEAVEENDKRIITNLWALLDEADIVIAHYALKFDVPKAKARFVIHGLPSPSFYHVIDTKQVALKEFGFSSNKLDALAKYFGFDTKMDTDFKLWVDCINGDESALSYMENYNRHDVIILEKVYKKILPYIKGHPNVTLYDEKHPDRCPSCGKGKLKNEGHYYTSVNKYPVLRCTECGSICRSRKAEEKKIPTKYVSIHGKF